jgi:hypothetical protein
MDSTNQTMKQPAHIHFYSKPPYNILSQEGMTTYTWTVQLILL